jgi:hypothetical protein
MSPSLTVGLRRPGFGRPLKKGEQTYDWYRKTHAHWAARRYGVDPKAVGDRKENVLNVRIDLLRVLHTLPQSERWEKIGLINDPDCVAAEKPDQYGLMIDAA